MSDDTWVLVERTHNRIPIRLTRERVGIFGTGAPNLFKGGLSFAG